MFELRPYQVEAENDISQLFTKGYRRVVMCMPTGSGKTVTFASMAVKAVRRGFIVGVCVDRKELLEQAHAKLHAYGLRPSLITAGKKSKRSHAYIATVQTLIRRPLPNVDMWIIDEAHKQTFDKLLQHPAYKDAFFIGATATPKRSGRMNQLQELYNDMIEPTTIAELIQKGYLVPAITYGKQIDITDIKITRGDFDPSQLFEKFDQGTLYAGVVSNYKRFAAGTKAVVFCINREHSEKTCREFTAAGINAYHLDGDTPKKERNRIIKAFSSGVIQVLCNCDILTTGFDEWTIETVIINRATTSLALWLQMCGRGSRPTPVELQGSPGYLQKDHFKIIDHGGNVRRHGFWEQDRDWSLSHKYKALEGVAPVKTCPEEDKVEAGILIYKGTGCGALVHASIMQCPQCGFKWPKKSKEAIKAEFTKLDNVIDLPDYLKKPYSQMGINELEQVRSIKKYPLNWIVRQILLHPTITLLEYQHLKNYKSGWAHLMAEQYSPKTVRE